MRKFKLTATLPADSKATGLVSIISEVAEKHSLDTREHQPHGMFEMPGFLELFLSGVSTVTLGVLASALFDKLKRSSSQGSEFKLHRIERQKIEISDPSSGLRILIVQESSDEISGNVG